MADDIIDGIERRLDGELRDDWESLIEGIAYTIDEMMDKHRRPRGTSGLRVDVPSSTGLGSKPRQQRSLPPTNSASKTTWSNRAFLLSTFCADEGQLARRPRSLYVLPGPILRKGPLWLIRSSSRKNPVKRKTSAPPSVRVTATSSRPRAICSTCSSRK